ncbi:D-sedoheptulose 7-phosphate isomerase [soil metagenome]
MGDLNDRQEDWLTDQFDEAARVQSSLRDKADVLLALAADMAAVLSSGGQVFFFGNGGSAADAQHWAAELSGKFYFDRAPLPAHALSTNASQVTAIANDYGYDEIFARPLAGMARPGDMVVGISTSGTSRNVVRALASVRERGLKTVAFCGRNSDQLSGLCDHIIAIDSTDVARIQEGHELAAHLVLGVVERALFGEPE